MADDVPGPATRPFSELRDHGLLWLVNRVVFHPRGFALCVELEDDGSVTGWGMLGDGTESWSFTPEADDEEFAKVEAFLASLRPAPVGEDTHVDEIADAANDHGERSLADMVAERPIDADA